jgi:hypothetical protein
MSDLRTTRSMIDFSEPFYLSALGRELPAGRYDVDTEEQIVQGNERTAYLRVATLLYVRTSGKVQIVTVDPIELDNIVAANRKPSGSISGSGID